MKNLFLLLVVVLVTFSCSNDAEYIVEEEAAISSLTTADRVAAVFNAPFNQDLDEAKNGLFKGFMASYDLTTKGTIVINTSDKERPEAAIKLVKGISGLEAKVYFEGMQDATDSNVYNFTSDRGSFSVTLNDDKQFRLEHFTFDGVDSYLVAYKKTRAVDVSVALGTYVDDTDPSFTGNWDAVHKGQTVISTSDQHAPATMGLLKLLDEIVITKGSNMIVSSDTPADNDPFNEPCFYSEVRGPFPHAWYYSTPSTSTYREFIGFNQTSTFAGRVASWSLSYYFDSAFFYDTPTCAFGGTGYGTWSWDGHSGKLFVDALPDL
jgi:hypothetical protein